MELSRDEEEALAGRRGEAMASAYRILVAIGEATGAKKLIPIKWAHVSGVNYNTIGDAGVQFLDKFSSTANVSVRTTSTRWATTGAGLETSSSISRKSRQALSGPTKG
jgi:predicted aconitase